MKGLYDYIITESKLSDTVFCEQFSQMFKDTKITNDTMQIILNNLEKDFILKLSNYFIEVDNSNYLAYDPGEDTFINYDENKTKIISQLSEYMIKYKV